MIDNNPKRETESEESLDIKKIHEQLKRAASIYLHDLESMSKDGFNSSTYYAEYLASYMFWISSEKIEKLTQRLNALTITLIILTIVLIGLTVATRLLP